MRLCVINPCYRNDLGQAVICAESYLAENRKKNWQCLWKEKQSPDVSLQMSLLAEEFSVQSSFYFPVAYHGLSYLHSTTVFHPILHHLSPNPRHSPQPISDEFTPFPQRSTAHFVPVPWTTLQVDSLTHRIHPQHIFPSMSAQLSTELCSLSSTSFTTHLPVTSLLEKEWGAAFLASVYCWHIFEDHDS